MRRYGGRVARTYGQHCGLARALDRIGERWTLLIVRELLLGPARYTDLRAALPGMATNLLSDRLRALEAEEIVRRRRLPPPAASTVYELTESGRGLEEAVAALIRWGGRWMREPVGKDAFRPQWLALAVRSLTRPQAHAGLPVTCEVEVSGDRFVLRVSERGAELAPEGDARGDALLRTDAQTMLAVASGDHPLAAAVASGAVQAEGDARAIDTLGRVWQTEASASAGRGAASGG